MRKSNILILILPKDTMKRYVAPLNFFVIFTAYITIMFPIITTRQIIPRGTNPPTTRESPI